MILSATAPHACRLACRDRCENSAWLHRNLRVRHLHHGVNGHVLSLPDEGQAAEIGVVVDVNEISAPNLIGSDQIRQWVDQSAIDGALQMACAVFQIGAFAQEEVFRLAAN